MNTIALIKLKLGNRLLNIYNWLYSHRLQLNTTWQKNIQKVVLIVTISLFIVSYNLDGIVTALLSNFEQTDTVLIAIKQYIKENPNLLDIGKWLFLINIIYIPSRFKPGMLLISTTTMKDRKLADISPELKTKYHIRQIKIDLTDLMSTNHITEAITKQDSIVQTLNLTTNYPIYFYGIAHTPLIFRFGYQMGDQININFLHKTRDNSSYFAPIPNTNNSETFSYEEFNSELASNELIVAVGSSFKINLNSLDSLGRDNKHILIFNPDNNNGFDILNSKCCMDNYLRIITRTIRSLYDQYEIKRIHMVLATSVSFTCYLAQQLANTYDPEIIVYHYEKEKGYVWGINIKEPSESAYIINNHIVFK